MLNSKEATDSVQKIDITSLLEGYKVQGDLSITHKVTPNGNHTYGGDDTPADGYFHPRFFPDLPK